jgi:hypothetical protein
MTGMNQWLFFDLIFFLSKIGTHNSFDSEILKELKSTRFLNFFKEDYFSKANDPISGSFWAQTRNPTKDCNQKERNTTKSLGLMSPRLSKNYINKIDRNQCCSTPPLELAINCQMIN